MRGVCAGAENDLVPLAHKTCGCLGAGAMAFVSGLDISNYNGCTSKAHCTRSALAELRCALCCLNSSMSAQHEVEAARAAGREFMPGCVAAVEDIASRSRQRH